MTDAQMRLSDIFNEWLHRYAKNPEQFQNLLDDDGKPAKNYGDAAAIYFEKIERELFGDGPEKLPGLWSMIRGASVEGNRVVLLVKAESTPHELLGRLLVEKRL